MQLTLPSHLPAIDRRWLHRLLVECQQQARHTQHPQIASIAVPLPHLDPLAVLAQLHQPDSVHFYWESQHQHQEIAAGGAVAQYRIGKGDRFAEAHQFIRTTLAHSRTEGYLDLPRAGVHFLGGFTFFPEPEAAGHFPAATLFVPRWMVARHADGCVATLSTAIDGQSHVAAEIASLAALERSLQGLATAQWPESHATQIPLELQHPHSTDEFRAAVVEALEAIAAGELRKIVLARAIELIAPQPLNPFQSLRNLRQLYPNCYVFSLGNSSGQQFLGASPEALMHVHQHRLAIDAIAGSAARGETSAGDLHLADRLLNSSKDRLEHRVVVDTIVQQLGQLGISAAAAASPSLLQLPNIQHLHTRICAQLPAQLHPFKVLAALHPTPAVAGVPRPLACDRIRQWESFERGLYAAPVGWIDGAGNCELAVAIRSALVDGDRVRLCAGAGIVAGSDPDREWAEVQLKLQALVRALV